MNSCIIQSHIDVSYPGDLRLIHFICSLLVPYLTVVVTETVKPKAPFVIKSPKQFVC